MFGKTFIKAVLTTVAASACLALPASQAMAATYHVAFSNTRFIDENGNTPLFGGEFTVQTDAPITAAGDYAATGCTLFDAPADYSCHSLQRFDPSDTGTGKSLVGVYLNYGGYPAPMMGFLWFEEGAFLTEGVHTLYTGLVTDGIEEYENFAEVGSLTVSLSTVPEPSALMLLLGGLGVVGAVSLRRTLPPRHRPA